MKINKLRFKNLNSLAGEWSIDFTSPEYVNDGIFAISGPTGAGKSTILDAICLALYGCTPRLERISDSTNEIMSRHAGDCFAEVVFETREGLFCAHWSQKRAYCKPEGALQAPKHEISEVPTGKILASQLKKTACVIIEKTGMDFSRFTQSMMLAQGGFAAFLKASGSDRAPILEQITGTEIYSQISMYVFQQQKAEKEILERLKAQNSGIMLMTQEEESEINRELSEMNGKKNLIAGDLERLDLSIKWLKRIADLKRELGEISEVESTVHREIIEFEPLRNNLKKAVKASNIDGCYASLKTLREQQETETRLLKDLNGNLPCLLDDAKIAAVNLETAQKKFLDRKIEREALLKLTRDVRSIDQDILQKESLSNKLRENINQMNSIITIENEKRSSLEKKKSALEIELDEIENYQKLNSTDSFLIEGYSGIESGLTRLLEALQHWSEIERKLKASKNELSSKQIDIEKINAKLLSSEQQQAKLHLNISSVLSEMNSILKGETPEAVVKRKDALIFQIAEMKKIGDYDKDRNMLQDGKPCPLCGSIHHPFAEGNIPSTSEAEKELKEILELLDSYTLLAKKYDKLQEEGRLSDQNLSEVKSRSEILKNQSEELQKKFAGNAKELEEAFTRLKKILDDLKITLLPLGINSQPTDIAEVDELKSLLKSRRDKWEKLETRKSDSNKGIQELNTNLAVSSTILESRETEIKEYNNEAEILLKSLSDLNTKRQQLFGNRKTDQEEEDAEKSINRAEQETITAAEDLKVKNEILIQNKAKISGLENNLHIRELALAKTTVEFNNLLHSAGFETEAIFLNARLSPVEREKLEIRHNKLEKQMTELSAKKMAKSGELKTEQSKNLTEENMETLSESYSSAFIQNETLLKEIGIRTGKLSANDAAKRRGNEIALKIADQNAIFERWSRLSSLIGSADGKKYRNFAQSLTLEIMISYANKQLSRLSDRYLLTRNKDEPLELDVIDNYQAGEIRSTKNLSGGESFIVSLSLALGLSKMSSRKVSVDSLFLDEGFGTLDEETLETSLSTLSGLRQDGKMIGIISHVGAIRERISTRIVVESVSEGRSIIKGPGVKKLN
jgi:exonuclease SbcC